MNREELRKQVDELLISGNYDEVKPRLLSYKDITEHDNDLATVCYLCTIYEQEKAAGHRETLFSKVHGMDELLERYTLLKFYLRRIEFDVMDDMGSFYLFLTQNRISSYEVVCVVNFAIIHKEKVLQVISSGVGTAEKAGDEEKDKNITDDADIQNDMRFCFILCTNNPVYAKECIYYINHLNIPEGIGVDILTVEEAKSLTSGYNEAMQFSKAKYKVYLHQDTFIINPDFIRNCLDIFEDNPQIGMIGNIGVKEMPVSGVMWDAERYGMFYEHHIYETKLLSNAIAPELKWMEMDAIDGFVMITQYDLLWREDLFDKWDFYDCSQCREFIRQGYSVVVPNMEKPWCVHDCGFANLENYDMERRKFVAEYLS